MPFAVVARFPLYFVKRAAQAFPHIVRDLVPLQRHASDLPQCQIDGFPAASGCRTRYAQDRVAAAFERGSEKGRGIFVLVIGRADLFAQFGQHHAHAPPLLTDHRTHFRNPALGGAGGKVIAVLAAQFPREFFFMQAFAPHGLRNFQPAYRTVLMQSCCQRGDFLLRRADAFSPALPLHGAVGAYFGKRPVIDFLRRRAVALIQSGGDTFHHC